MIDRKRGCPKCNYNLIAREDDDVICLSPSCDWRILSKRKEDEEISKIQDLKDGWG